MDGAIIVGGTKHVIRDQRIHTWHDSGLAFAEGEGAEPREEEIRGIVLHVTASTRDGIDGARIFHYSMGQRQTPLSVEFLVDESGTIWQFFDPTGLRGRHASRVNPYTVGIEVSGLLLAKPGREPRKARYRSPPLAGGWKPTLIEYGSAQQLAVNRLCSTLCDALDVPRSVLLAPWVRRPRGFFSQHWQGGIIGHIHCAHLAVKHPKIDPGPMPLIKVANALASEGRNGEE